MQRAAGGWRSACSNVPTTTGAAQLNETFMTWAALQTPQGKSLAAADLA